MPYRLTSTKGGSHTWFTNTWISISCIFEACTSLTLSRSSAVQHFVRGNVFKVFDRIIVNFYTRLSHVHLWSKLHMHMCNAVMWVWDSLNNTISFVFRLSNKGSLRKKLVHTVAITVCHKNINVTNVWDAQCVVVYPYLHGCAELLSIILWGCHHQGNSRTLKTATQITLQVTDKIL